MALTPSGQISMSDINSALGRSSTASIDFNDANVRFLANQESGSVTMAAMRSKYYFTGTITVGRLYVEGDVQYGFNSGYMGSITGTIGGTMINFFAYGSGYSSYIDSTSLPFAANGRAKIASGSTYAMIYRPPDEKNPDAYYYANSAFLSAGNYTGTYTWQFGSN